MWFILWPLSLLFTVLAILLAPLLPAFASADGWLTKGLWYFQTPDNPKDGDSGFQSEHAPFLREQTGWRRYINRIAWLVRNPAYGANFGLFGFSPTGGWNVACRGDSAVDDTHDGWYFKSCQGGVAVLPHPSLDPDLLPQNQHRLEALVAALCAQDRIRSESLEAELAFS